jgi:hypothetical protein
MGRRLRGYVLLIIITVQVEPGVEAPFQVAESLRYETLHCELFFLAEKADC